MVVWYNLWSFGMFFPFWHVSTKKNLAPLKRRGGKSYRRNFVGLIMSGCAGERLSGLPDFSGYNIPKREKYTKITI
jgi:hypothetical protein